MSGERLSSATGDTEFLHVNGARLECRRIGPSADRAPTLVFLHEGLGCAGLWRDFPDRLAERLSFGGFVFSRAGFGRSSAGVFPWPLDYHERDARDGLPAVLTAAGIGRALMVGHSDGGTIALIHAGACADPRVQAVVTLAAHVFNEEETIAGIEATKRTYLSSAMADRLARHHGTNAEAVFWGWCDTWLHPAFRDWNVERYLPGITPPVLAIQGADDPYGTDAQVEAIVRGVGGAATPLILPDCGHTPQREQPEAVIEAVARFVERHDLG
jgi:pimeloyl-ACP methyl ester carboxylesterase